MPRHATLHCGLLRRAVHRRAMRCHAHAAAFAAALLLPAAAGAAPTDILFLGNSFTHGKYDPVRTYMSGFGTGTGNVHDVNCLTLATCSSAETTPPAQGTFESGPFGGIPGIFLKLTQEAGLSYNVSIDAVSSATLMGATAAARLPAIQTNPLTGLPYDKVVLQEQSFTPLPNPNGLGNATRGNYANFVSGANTLVSRIRQADSAAGKPAAGIYLYETQPLASYVYASPLIQGTSTGGLNQPYVGAPIETLAADIHNAYAGVAAQNAGITGVAYAGDAWIRAIQDGVAQRNPYLATEPAGQVDLWDSDVTAACCTTPIGYHPSAYGAYLNALVLFDTITGTNAQAFGGAEQAAAALGINPSVAVALQAEAAATVPEPATGALVAAGLLGLAALRRRAI